MENILMPEEMNLLSISKIISEVSAKYDKLWVKRNRSIDSKFLVSFILQVISNKNKGYGISLLELWDNYEKNNINIPQKKVFAASSVCEARQKLPEDIFVDLNKMLISQFAAQEEGSLLLNKHRVFAIDGSRLNIPKELIDYGYKKCNKDSHYPQGLMSCIYNIDTQIVHDFCLAKSLNERSCALEHLNVLEEDDIVIFDRGYFSYIFLHQCKERKIHPIFRVSLSLGNKGIQDFVSSDKTDSVIAFSPSPTVKNQLKRQGFDLEFKPISIRLVKYTINGNLYLYATTLIGKEYDENLFSVLYNKRWEIEELYKISKCLVDVEAFHSKSERGLKQEVYAHFVLINLARFFERVTKIKYKNNDQDVKYNFKNCLNIIGREIQTIIYKSRMLITKTIVKITAHIAQVKQKIRPKRKYQRISHKPFNRWVLNRSPHWS